MQKPRELVGNNILRIILLNRKRPGELQRLQLHAYMSSENENQNYEEFADVITPTEKMLMQKFKRLVIRGKRARGVSVLYSTDVQKDIETIIKFRPNFVPGNNNYLFAVPHTTAHYTWI